METSRSLFEILPQIGRLDWIGLRPSPMAELIRVDEATAVTERGLEGDHKVAGKVGAKRQVTLIQHEHLVDLAGLLHWDSVPVASIQRNLFVA